jgi:hypothetical protein
MDFDAFWEAYPKRKPWPNPKATAKKAFDKALKRGATPQDLVTGATMYSEFCRDHGTQPQFICMASTFLNQDRYEDYLDYESAPKPAKPKPSDLARMMGLGKRI